MDDWQLLDEFIRLGSEEAFRKLVERHAGMVVASAWRQVSDEQLAQDIAQAVFILLARKAKSLRRGTVLAGWLFQTTRFLAARAMRSEQRRHLREQEAFQMNQIDSPDETWRRLAPVIDQALAGLSPRDREAILLRFFEDKSIGEAATAMGVNEAAAKKRLARALERLREAVRVHGMTVTASALALALGVQTSWAVPAKMISQWSGGALSAATAGNAAGLAADVLRSWFWRKLAWAGSIGTVAVAVVGSITWPRSERTPPTIASSALPIRNSPNLPTQEVVPAGQAVTETMTNRFLQLRVEAVDTGEAIANARIARNYVSGGQWIKRFDLMTDANGQCAVPFPHDAERLDVGVFAAGWATLAAVWPSEGAAGIPAHYTLRLDQVNQAIGGRVQDEFKRPIAGVEIWFSGNDTGDSGHRERPRERFGFFSIPLANTDSQGRWSLPFVPTKHPGFQIEAKHPEFADTLVASSGPHQSLSEIESEELRQLWAGELVTTLNPAFTLTGLIVDEQQQPIVGAKIQEREQSEIFVTDSTGTFRVPKLKPGPWNFTVTADGFAPFRKETVVGPKMPPLVVTVQTGAVLRLRVMDELEADVAGATVGMEQWGPNRHTFEWRAKTDRSGRIEWLSAPRDVDLELFARSDEHCWTRDIRVKADGSEHVITLRRKLDVYGRVVDADAGYGIREFKAVPAYGGPERYHYDSELRWAGSETVRGTNGLFKLTFVENHLPWQVKVMADGYEDWISASLTNFGQVTLDVAMRRSSVDESVRGVVLLPNGQPAADAQVALLTFEHNVRLRERAFEGNKRWIMLTDSQGAFQFAVNSEAHSVVAVNLDGYVLLRLSKEQEPVTLQLQPWGRVEVTVDESARAHPVQTIELYDPAADNYQGRVSLLGSYSKKAGADGRFVFEQVPPGECNVFINSGVGITYHHGTHVVVTPGETTTVAIRKRAGTLVNGRLTPVPQFAAPGDHLVLHFNPDPINPAPFQDLPPDERRQKEFEFWSSRAGRERVNDSRRTYVARLNPDGSFVSLEHIPPGSYRFNAIFKNTSSSQNVVIGNISDSVLNLGEIRLRGPDE